MSTAATTATSPATTHLLNPKQEDQNLEIVSNGELDNKVEEMLITQDSISSEEDVDSPVKSGPDLPQLGPQFSLKEEIDMYKDGGSLRKWKEQPLGSVVGVDVSREAISKEAEVKVLRMMLQSPGRADIVKTTPYQATTAKSPLFTLKEGCTQQAMFEFVVSKNTVCGLKYIADVWKKGIKVDHAENMVGTFGPREEPYRFELEKSTIPCGFFVRGTYVARTRFVDDDGKCHFEATYYFDIQKNWGS